MYWVGQKVACLLLHYLCLSILQRTNFHNFGKCTVYTIGNLQLDCIVGPPNTVYVTTLPCKILITTLLMFTLVYQTVDLLLW